MKKSELKQLIREAISEVLAEPRMEEYNMAFPMEKYEVMRKFFLGLEKKLGPRRFSVYVPTKEEIISDPESFQRRAAFVYRHQPKSEKKKLWFDVCFASDPEVMDPYKIGDWCKKHGIESA